MLRANKRKTGKTAAIRTVSNRPRRLKKKKGPLQKIFGIFGGKKKKDPDKPDRDKGDSP